MTIIEEIKQMLGIHADTEVFDTNIKVGINSAFMTLNQLGVGPEETFSITDESVVWEDFLEGKANIEAARSYVYLKVRMFFDPPGNSFLVEAIKNQIEELEWRLMAQEMKNDKEVI